MSADDDAPAPERHPGTSAPLRDAGDDDHDLLTYGEAAVRLHEEITAQRTIIAARVGVDDSGENPDPELDAAQRRLQLLEEAAERNFRGRINDGNFERFFGYQGTAKRNT